MKAYSVHRRFSRLLRPAQADSAANLASPLIPPLSAITPRFDDENGIVGCPFLLLPIQLLKFRTLLLEFGAAGHYSGCDGCHAVLATPAPYKGCPELPSVASFASPRFPLALATEIAATSLSFVKSGDRRRCLDFLYS